MSILPQQKVLTKNKPIQPHAGEPGKENRMGLLDEHTFMDETENWPAEFQFQKINQHRMGRNLSPSREVSPVPSYYSEPVSVQQHKYESGRLPAFLREAHQREEDDEDTQSSKSLPTVMNIAAPNSKVKGSHNLPKGQMTSDFILPFLVTSKCTLVVKGTGYTRTRGFLPAINPKGPCEHSSLERPPGRAGCRPSKTEMAAASHVLNATHSQSLFEKTWNTREGFPSPTSKLTLGSQIPIQNPMERADYPITPDMKESRQTAQDWQPLRPELKNASVMKRKTLQCMFQDNYFLCPRDPYLLEPISGFQKHLCHQLLNSPMPQVKPYHLLHLEAMLPVQQGPDVSTQVGHTIKLCNSHGKRLPSITMTCPTPSPKQLHHSENSRVV